MKVIGERVIIERQTVRLTEIGTEMEDTRKRGLVTHSNVSGVEVGKYIYYKTADLLEGDIYAVDKENILAEEDND